MISHLNNDSTDTVGRNFRIQAPAFQLYVNTILPSEEARLLLKELSSQCEVYVFGGVIRNFLLGYPFHRDLDFVVCTDHPLSLSFRLLRRFNITKNKFSGIKLTQGNFTVDIWNIKDSWGIIHRGGKNTPYNLLNTVFFNFSAIIFNYNTPRFISTELFDVFYKNLTMEVVYARNPFPSSCIVNSFHYTQEYNFTIGKSLRKWICKYAHDEEYEQQQLRRYGEILYSNDVINAFVDLCKKVRTPNTVVSIFDSNQKQYIVKFG